MRFATWCAPVKVLAAALAISAIAIAAPAPARAESHGAPAVTPMRKAAELIQKQEPPNVTPRVLDKLTPENARILVSLSQQRAYLMAGDEVAIDTPVSTGKSAGMTPAGKFTVQEKDPHHRAPIYGNFVDNRGRVVRAGVSMRIDSAPSGTRFVNAPMDWFCRFNETFGLHAGILPGYPAAHGCVRLPSDAIAQMIYDRVKVGTPVEITP